MNEFLYAVASGGLYVSLASIVVWACRRVK